MKCTILLIAVLLSFSTYAQQVTGKVVDATTGDLMTGTVVILLNKSDTTKIKSTLVDVDGMFKINVVNGTYIVRTLLVGYKPAQFEITIFKENKDLGIIQISEDIQTDEVLITEKLERVQQKGD